MAKISHNSHIGVVGLKNKTSVSITFNKVVHSFSNIKYKNKQFKTLYHCFNKSYMNKHLLFLINFSNKIFTVLTHIF